MKELTPHDPGHCACLRLALNDLTPAAGRWGQGRWDAARGQDAKGVCTDYCHVLIWVIRCYKCLWSVSMVSVAIGERSSDGLGPHLFACWTTSLPFAMLFAKGLPQLPAQPPDEYRLSLGKITDTLRQEICCILDVLECLEKQPNMSRKWK